MKLQKIALSVSLICSLGGAALAADVAPKDVKFVDDTEIMESLTGVAGDPKGWAQMVCGP